MKKLFFALCGLLIAPISYCATVREIIISGCGGEARGNVKSWIFDMDPEVMNVNFDDQNRITSAQSGPISYSFSYANGAVSYSYKGVGSEKMECYEGPDSTRQFLYGEDGKLSLVLKASNDSHGNLLNVKVYDGNGKVKSTFKYSYTYDANGRKTEVKKFQDGKLTNTTKYTYDAKGVLSSEKEIDPNGKVAKLTKYNFHGDPIQEIYYKNGVKVQSLTVSYVYDNKGNWTKRTSDGRTTTKKIIYR